MTGMKMERGELKRKKKPRRPYFSYLSSPKKLIPQRTLYRQNQNINVDDEVVDVFDVQCEVDEEVEMNLSDKFSISAEEKWEEGL